VVVGAGAVVLVVAAAVEVVVAAGLAASGERVEPPHPARAANKTRAPPRYRFGRWRTMATQPRAALLVLGAALVAGCSAAPAHRAANVARSAQTLLSPPPSLTAPPATSTTTSVALAAPPRPDAATTTTTSRVAAAAACPANLVTSLASTGSARQLITVEGPAYSSTVATLETWQREGACWTPVAGPWEARVGENGFSDHHIEGDGTTPTGLYSIGPTMYGNAPNPGVQEPYHRLVCGDWWDEDPTSPQYNTFQHVPCGQQPPFGGGSEALWKETAAYPSFAVIDFNTDPVVPDAGSAIFLHADTGTPTDGCVALPVGELDQVLRWINPADSPAVVMAPSVEIDRF
jgi:L,D-peptidoglycan transpeptidase YkuD (ErfK/YbiS/YcfS/YnhG family)